MSVRNALNGLLHGVQRKSRKKAFPDMEKNCRLMVEHSVAGIYVIQDDRFKYVNEQWCKIHGYSFGEVVDKVSPLELVHPEDRETVRKNIRKRVSGRARFIEYEFRILRKDGNIIWVRVFGSRMFFNERPAVTGTVIDITDRRRIEINLLESEEKFRGLVEQSLVGVYMIQDDLFRYVNNRFCEIFGYSYDEIVDKLGPTALAYKEDKVLVEENIRKRIAGEPKSIEYELRAEKKNGELVYVRVLGYQMMYQNRPAITGTLIDLTAEKAAEEIKRKEAERGNILLELYKKAPRLEEKQLYDFVLDHAVSITDSSIGFLHQVSDDQKSIILTTWNSKALKSCTANYDTHYPVKEAGNWADCIKTRQPVIYNDYSLSPNQKGLPKGHIGLNRFMSIPVLEDDKVRIIFGVGNKVQAYTESDAMNIELIANELQKIINQRHGEERIRESEEQYRTLIQKIKAAVVVHSGDTRIITSNSMAQELLGLTGEQMLGKSSIDKDWNFFREDGSRMLPEEYPVNRVLSTKKELKNYVVGVHRSDKKQDVWALVNADPVFDKQKEITLVIVTFVDISERKKNQEALQQAHDEMEKRVEERTAELKRANQQLEALYKVGQTITAPLNLKKVLDVIARSTVKLLGSDTGVILLIDEKDETLAIKGSYGLSKQVVNGTHDKIGESIAGRVVQSGEPIIANDLQNDPRFENPSAADEGLLSCASVPLKIGGRIIGTLDIHSKKEQFAFNEGHIQVLNMLASQAAIAIENARLYEKNQRAKDELETRVKERTSELASVNALLSAIIEAAPTAIFDLDLNGKVNTIWNPAAERILGWKREEVIGKELPSVPNEKKKEFAEFRSQIRSGNIIDGIEVQCQKRDGTPIDYCIYASPLKDAENIIHGNVAVLMDITERKKHEREIAQMNRTLRMLSNSNQVLIHSSDEKSMYEEICRNITITAGYTLAWVGLVDQENQETLIPVAQVSQHEEISEYIFKYWQEANADDNLFIKSAQTGRAIINYDLQSDSTSPLIRDTAIQHGYSSVIALPIINEGNTLGVLGIFSAETDVFHAKEVEILKELANDLAFGVSSFRARIRKLQAEEDLRASEERFYAVFRYSPVAIAIVRAENGNIVDVNDTFITTSGYSREELIGHTTNELSLYRNPADRDHILQMLHEKGSIDSFEFDVRIKSGEIKSVISAITFIDIKDERHYLILMLDITRRKKSEEQLHLLSKALEATANSILITNRDAIIIWANNAFSKLSGYSLDEVIGKNPRDLVYSGIHSKDYYQHMWQTILSGNEWQGEIINKRKDNSIYNEFLTITPVRDEKNEIRHFIAVKQDITSQKMAEEELRTAKDKAEESNRLKNAFLATMNHELRTPLNHIIGFSDLMSSGSLLDNIPQYASIIYTSSKNLLEIIEDIFELALAEQSELKLRLQTFKCLDLFLNNKSSLTEILETSGKTEQIELVFNADQELLIQNVTADRTKINQVLGNLFKNAVKFTKSGKIEFGLKKGEPDWLNFYVKDTGIGIPEDKREIIFEFFRQLDDSDTREYGGVGIGLAISQRIVEVMKGSLTVESVPGEGSTFYFRIPVIMQSQDTKFIDTDKDLMIPDLEGKSFIIAEDDPVSTELIKNYLLPTGVKIVTVSNGKEVIENLSINPSLILMDLNMPVMDGYSATRKVKLKRPEIPVIAITAYALPTDQKKAKNAGCDGIISKPVDKHLLFEELKKHLGIE